MKATIHFNADRIVILNEINIAVACLPSYLGIPKDKVATIQNTRSDLEKLRLEAVIQKEAEEKYPDKSTPGWNDHWSFKNRLVFIKTWQSLIERLPSEDIKESSYKKFPIDDFGDDIKQDIDAERRTIWIEAATWAKSMFLPSLPSILSCEVEEENGKIEVKKIWI